MSHDAAGHYDAVHEHIPHPPRKTRGAPVANPIMSGRHTSPAVPPPPSGPVVEWRRRRLLAAGFAPDLAADLARGNDVDLHALLDLIDRGCPPQLAARILAPLDPTQRERRSRYRTLFAWLGPAPPRPRRGRRPRFPPANAASTPNLRNGSTRSR